MLEQMSPRMPVLATGSSSSGSGCNLNEVGRSAGFKDFVGENDHLEPALDKVSIHSF